MSITFALLPSGQLLNLNHVVAINGALQIGPPQVTYTDHTTNGASDAAYHNYEYPLSDEGLNALYDLITGASPTKGRLITTGS